MQRERSPIRTPLYLTSAPLPPSCQSWRSGMTCDAREASREFLDRLLAGGVAKSVEIPERGLRAGFV